MIKNVFYIKRAHKTADKWKMQYKAEKRLLNCYVNFEWNAYTLYTVCVLIVMYLKYITFIYLAYNKIKYIKRENWINDQQHHAYAPCANGDDK